MKISFLYIVFFMLILNTYAQESKVDQVNKQLRQLLKKTMNHQGENPVHGVQLLISSPKQGFYWRGNEGVVDWDTKERITDKHPLQIASITKMITAALVLKLVEEDYISLKASISRYLPDSLVHKLIYVDRESYGSKIKIIDLLRHTSGLADVIFEDDHFLAQVFKHPSTQWNPDSLLKNYLNSNLPENPFGVPGKSFHYSDTNYLLLGLIIEQVTRLSLSEAYRTFIFYPLDIPQAYLAYHDQKTENKHTVVSDRYGQINMRDINTSFDWGGGGLVMRPEELYIFVRQLFTGKLFSKKKTLKIYLDGIEIEDSGYERYAYACGIAEVKMEGLPVFWGHSGFYASFLLYMPEADLYIIGGLHQVHADHKTFIRRIVGILEASKAINFNRQ